MLGEDNFVQYAMRAYDNPQCRTIEQFKSDVSRFSFVKKILKSDKHDSEFVAMTLNNIVSLYNVFNSTECTLMLFYKVRKQHWFRLKTYLLYLNYMPENIPDLNINSTDIPICLEIAKELRII